MEFGSMMCMLETWAQRAVCIEWCVSGNNISSDHTNISYTQPACASCIFQWEEGKKTNCKLATFQFMQLIIYFDIFGFISHTCFIYDTEKNKWPKAFVSISQIEYRLVLTFRLVLPNGTYFPEEYQCLNQHFIHLFIQLVGFCERWWWWWWFCCLFLLFKWILQSKTRKQANDIFNK